MCQYSAENGLATAWHMIHLGNLALSRAGILSIEATAVESVGRITPGCLGLWDDATEAALEPVLAAIRRHSPIRLVQQLAHAGRKASSEVPWRGGQLIPVAAGGWLPRGPSALEHKQGEPPPLVQDAAGLRRVREAFVNSARRAARLEVDGIELHLAHGYLLHQFLSPISNRRTDEYGGSLANRLRFPLQKIALGPGYQIDPIAVEIEYLTVGRNASQATARTAGSIQRSMPPRAVTAPDADNATGSSTLRWNSAIAPNVPTAQLVSGSAN